MTDIETLGERIVARAESEKASITDLDRLNLTCDGAIMDVSALMKKGWKTSTPCGCLHYAKDRTGGMTLRYPICTDGKAYVAVLHTGEFLGGRSKTSVGFARVTREELRRGTQAEHGLVAYLRRIAVRELTLEGKPSDDIVSDAPEAVLSVLKDAVTEHIVMPVLTLCEDLDYQTDGFRWNGLKMPNDYDEKWAIYEDILDSRATIHSKYRLLMPIVRTLTLTPDERDRAALNQIVSPLLPVAFMDDARKLNERKLVVQLMAWFFSKYRGTLKRIDDTDARTIWMRIREAAKLIDEPLLALVAQDFNMRSQFADFDSSADILAFGQCAKLCLEDRFADKIDPSDVLDVLKPYEPLEEAKNLEQIFSRLRKRIDASS